MENRTKCDTTQLNQKLVKFSLVIFQILLDICKVSLFSGGGRIFKCKGLHLYKADDYGSDLELQ